MFCRPDGVPIHPDVLTKAFRRVKTKMGLGDVRLHDLRHTHATWLLEEGVDLKSVSDRLGHFSAAYTADTYGHVTKKMRSELIDRLESKRSQNRSQDDVEEPAKSSI